MHTRDITISLLALAIGITLIFSAGSQLDYINAQRKEMNLVRNEPLENAPPSLAFSTVALGAFRGLIVDALWIRADQLKMEGRFFDAKQLAEWIVALQPRFTKVWEYQAWNMAYNISVTIPASQPDQRWHWVKNGYELLRDKGIVVNPSDLGLYRELARIFQHKMGGVSDDAHLYYKLKLAEAFGPLLGPADEEFFERLAKTPKTPEQITSDPNMVRFIDELKAADSAFVEKEKFVSSYLALRQQPAKFKPEAFAVIDRYRGSETLDEFDIFAKAYQIRTVWKLEPELILDINKQYGPLDFDDPNHRLPLEWRHPATHAIYWAVKGLSLDKNQHHDVQKTNTYRIIVHSLQSLFREGEIFIYEAPKSDDPVKRTDRKPGLEKMIYLRPDLRMFKAYHLAQLEIARQYEALGDRSYTTFQTGHKNFLVNAAANFHFTGHENYARGIYKIIQELYPDKKEFKVSYTRFIRNRLKEEVEGLDIYNATEMVTGFLREAYFRYAMRDDDAAANQENLASEVHRNYLLEFSDEQHRIGLPNMARMRYMALLDFLNDSLYPVELRKALLARIKLEKPELAKQLEQQEKAFMKEVEEYRKNQQQNQP